MRSIPEQRIAEFQEQDYQLYFGVSKLEFDRMLKALQEAYRQEHKRKTRFTKISMMDKLILTLSIATNTARWRALQGNTRSLWIPLPTTSIGWSAHCSTQISCKPV